MGLLIIFTITLKLTTMKLNKKDFFQMVLDEVNHIKANATSEEIRKLNFKSLIPVNASYCIYGQMTGNCDSDRAKQLYPKSLHGVYEGTFTEFKRVNNEWKDTGIAFTPIEAYILLKGAKNESLIQYLKGEINTWKP